MFKKFQIGEEIKRIESEWSDFYGNQFSIRSDGDNRKAGNFAEIIFQKMYPHALRISDVDQNADFLLRKKRIDVKTKVRSVDPQDFFDASVEKRQKLFDVDFYCFFSFNSKTEVMSYCGWISKAEFFDRAAVVKQGDLDKTNNWKASVDCFNLRYDCLNR
jgi:hypothetical protein